MSGTIPVLTALSEATWTVQAVTEAHHVGMLSRLEAGPVDVGTAALDCALTARDAHALLDCLTTLGLASTADGVYRGAAAGIAELGRRVAEPSPRTTPGSRTDAYPAVVEHLAALMAPAAALLAPPGSRILDIGCGAAPWSLAIARTDPACTITALHCPDVLPVTRSAVAAAGLLERFHLVAGDMLTAPFEDLFDLALLANVCHLLDEQTNRHLIAKTCAALRPGGRIAIIDVLPRARPTRSLALYRFGLLHRTATGDVHPEQAYQTWLADGGFSRCTTTDLGQEPGLALITAVAEP